MNDIIERTSGEGPQETFGLSQAKQYMDSILNNVKANNLQLSGTSLATPDEINSVFKTFMIKKKIKASRDNYGKVYVTLLYMTQIGSISQKYAGSRTLMNYGFCY